MSYLLAGIAIVGASVGGLWVCLPRPDGIARPHLLKSGLDTWIAVAITFGAALGAGGAIIIGMTEIMS